VVASGQLYSRRKALPRWGSMLAGLIPGIWQIRAPLAAGYLWLFALWLALKPNLPSQDEATGVVADVIDLADAAAPVAVAVAVSFAAYLIGSISDTVLRAGRSVWTEWAERLPDAIRVLATRHDYGRGMSPLRARIVATTPSTRPQWNACGRSSHASLARTAVSKTSPRTSSSRSASSTPIRGPEVAGLSRSERVLAIAQDLGPQLDRAGRV
jgi:hypothetical protein